MSLLLIMVSYPSQWARYPESIRKKFCDMTGLTGQMATAQVPRAHTHPAGSITSGVLDGDRLPAPSETKRGGVPAIGTPGGKFLRDDNTWQSVGGGSTPSGTGFRHVTDSNEDPGAKLVGNADVDGEAAIAESKLNLNFPTHNNDGDHTQNTDTGTAAANFSISGANAIKEGDGRLADARIPTVHGSDKHSVEYEAAGVVATHAAVTASVHGFDGDGNAPPQDHSAAKITSGTLDGDRLPSVSATKRGGVPPTGSPAGLFLKDDGTWAAAGGGGGGSHMFVQMLSDETTVVLTNQAAAEQFILNTYRYNVRIDLGSFSDVRLMVNKAATAGYAGAKLMVKYSPTWSTVVGNYSDIGTSEVSVGIAVTNTLLSSAWIPLAAGAKGDVIVCITQVGGNGTLDPAFGSIALEFRG